jgi:hypothetical protein
MRLTKSDCAAAAVAAIAMIKPTMRMRRMPMPLTRRPYEL